MKTRIEIVLGRKPKTKKKYLSPTPYTSTPGDSDLGNGGIKLLRKYNVVRKPKKISPDSFTEKVCQLPKNLPKRCQKKKICQKR